MHVNDFHTQADGAGGQLRVRGRRGAVARPLHARHPRHVAQRVGLQAAVRHPVERRVELLRRHVRTEPEITLQITNLAIA